MKKHRHPKQLFVKPAQNANADINVTPLVDVVLVLLIIFMVVTPLLEKDIPVRTPNSEVDIPDEVPPDQLVVYVYKDGSLRLNTERVTSADLIPKLKASLDRKPNPDDKVVFFVSEDECNYGKFVHVLDQAREAGAEVLGFATDKPDPSIFM
jgi:biopolymer transport protein TolR